MSINLHTTSTGGIDWSSVTAEATHQRASWVQETAGDRFHELELNILVMAAIVTHKPRESAENLAKDWGIDQKDITVDGLLESPYFLFGSENEIIDKLQSIRERDGISYFTLMGEDCMDSFAPILARLAGT